MSVDYNALGLKSEFWCGGDVTLTEKGREKQVRRHTAAGAVFPHQLARRRAVRACPAGGCGWGWARSPGALAWLSACTRVHAAP